MEIRICIIVLSICSIIGQVNSVKSKYFGFEEHILGRDGELTTIQHNPMQDDGGDAHTVFRREIFGIDDREEVDRDSVDEGDRVPEQATVLISIGCTGMLITREHVLTAAHCVYTAGHFKEGYSDLEVAVEMEYGLEWRRVVAIFLPSNWTKPDPSTNQDYYDYAVLRIEPLSPPSPHLPIALTSSSQHGVNSEISVVAYFDDKPKKTKWITSCKVVDEDAGILWHECDVTYGASGAGMYGPHLHNNQWVLRNVGILSGYNYDTNRHKELNYAVRINPVNYFYICSWSCQLSWCLNELTQQDRMAIIRMGDGWVIDKLESSRPPYCADN